MKKYRVYRGNSKWAVGSMYNADNARDAVRQDENATRQAMGVGEVVAEVFGTFKPEPIVAVYELVKVDEEDWK